MTMNGPLSPEELARANAYYGGEGISSSASTPAPIGPPAPPAVPTVPYGQVDTTSYFGPAPTPPAGPPEVSTWNPNEQTAADAARFMGKPAARLQPPSGGVPSVASLRSDSAVMNAAAAGAPKVASTPEQDRAAAALAHYGGASSKAKGAGGPTLGGPGGPANSDPFGIKGARKGLYGTYDTEEGAMQRGATNEEGRADTLAAGMGVLASAQQKEAERQAVEAAHEAQIFRNHMEESQQQLDAVRSEKVDPHRMYSDGGSIFAAVIGGVMGGMYQGLNKLEKNPFTEDMNRSIQQDIALQERELGRKTDSIKERQSLLGQMRSIYKDENVAKVQAQNLMYEGLKQQLQADAATYDSPAIQAKVDQAVATVDREQKKLKLSDAMQAAAQAQAAAAAKRAAEKEQREFDLKMYEAGTHRIAAEKTGEGKEPSLRTRFVATGQDKEGPTGYLARNAEEAKERDAARIAAKQLLGKIDRAIEIRNEEGALGRTINRNDPDAAVQIYKPEWQTKLKALSSEMTTDWAHAKKLGALSDSDRKLADGAIGDLMSRGSESEVRLTELRRTLEASLKAEDDVSAGTRVRMRPDESIEPIGGVNAPLNSRGNSPVRREPAR